MSEEPKRALPGGIRIEVNKYLGPYEGVLFCGVALYEQIKASVAKVPESPKEPDATR